MEKSMSNSIKNLVNTGGWKEVEKIMYDFIEKCKDPSNIDETLPDDIYAREVRTRVLAANTVKHLIKNIKLSAGNSPVDKISYK